MITLLYSARQATPRVLCSVLVPTIQGYRQTRGGPKEGHKDDERAGEPAVQGKTKGIRSFLPGGEKARGSLTAVFQYLKDGYKEEGDSLLHKEPHGENKG